MFKVKRIKTVRSKKVKLYCDDCGSDLYYYVDGNNISITNNSKGVCRNLNCPSKKAN